MHVGVAGAVAAAADNSGRKRPFSTAVRACWMMVFERCVDLYKYNCRQIQLPKCVEY